MSERPSRDELFAALQSWKEFMDLLRVEEIETHLEKVSNDVRGLVGGDMPVIHQSLPELPDDLESREGTWLGPLLVSEFAGFTPSFKGGTQAVIEGVCDFPRDALIQRPFVRLEKRVYVTETAPHFEYPVAVALPRYYEWVGQRQETSARGEFVYLRSDAPRTLEGRIFRMS